MVALTPHGSNTIRPNIMNVRQLLLQATIPCLNGWGHALPASMQATCSALGCSRPGLGCTHSASCFCSRSLHTSAPSSLLCSSTPSILDATAPCSSASQVHVASISTEAKEADDTEIPSPERVHLFVSQEHARLKQRPIATPQSPMQPHRRIYFPTLTLQMMRPTEQELKQIEETGWTREVAFKTTPNVTKLEIKAYLESVYGMKVERVSTINYLGKTYSVPSSKVNAKARSVIMREDDWKKAYVIFAPPPGITMPTPPPQESPLEMLRALRALRRPMAARSAEEPGESRRKPVTHICTRTGTIIHPHWVLRKGGLDKVPLPAPVTAPDEAAPEEKKEP